LPEVHSCGIVPEDDNNATTEQRRNMHSEISIVSWLKKRLILISLAIITSAATITSSVSGYDTATLVVGTVAGIINIFLVGEFIVLFFPTKD